MEDNKHADPDPSKCPGCEKSYGDANPKMSCPACEWFRCDEWFKFENKNSDTNELSEYICGYCLENWTVKDNNGNITAPDLNYADITPRSDDFITVTVETENGRDLPFRVRKNKTFKVLMSKIRFGIYKQEASFNETTPDKIAKQYTDSKSKYNVKFKQGQSELNEKSKMEIIGNNARIKAVIKYIGG